MSRRESSFAVAAAPAPVREGPARAEPRGGGLTAKLVAASAALGLGLVGAGVVAAHVVDRPFVYLTRDPAAELGAPWYVGSLSYVGVLVLWTAAIVCALVGLLLRRSGEASAEPLLSAAALSALFALDDLFQLHEKVLPGTVGLSQRAVLVGYALLLAAFAARNRRFLRSTRWSLLLIAGVLFGSAVLADVVGDTTGSKVHLVEDGAKLVGYVFWTAFFGSIAVARLAGEITHRRVER